MKGMIKLVLKENLRKNSFVVYGFLGALVTVLILFNMEYSVNGVAATTDHAVYGFQWNVLLFIASLAGVILSATGVSTHREGGRVELLRLHGLGISDQYQGVIFANGLVSMAMGLVLLCGMLLQVVAKGPETTVLAMLFAILIYLLAVVTMSTITSALTLVMAPAFSALFGFIIAGVGFFRGGLLLMVGNRGGLFGKGMGAVLSIFPPIDQFGEVVRDVFLLTFSDGHKLFGLLLYLWVVIGFIVIGTKVVGKREG